MRCHITEEYALHVAMNHGYLETVKILVEHGADVNLPTNYGVPPVISAIRQERLQIATYLVEHGADVNMTINTITPLMTSIQFPNTPVSFIELLLKHGANVNARDNQSATPLIWALKYRIGNDVHIMPIVQLLLKYGADANVKTIDRNRVLYYAIWNEERDKLLEVLLPYITHIDEESTHHLQHSPLMMLLDCGSSPATLNLFLQRGVDVNYKDLNHRTALCYAVENKKTDHARLLLEYNATVKHVYCDGDDLLSFCARSIKSADMPQLLLRYSASTKAVNRDAIEGDTLVDVATRNNNKEFLEFFQEYMNVVHSGKWLAKCASLDTLPIAFGKHATVLACMWSASLHSGESTLTQLPLELLHELLRELLVVFVCDEFSMV